MKKTTLLKSMLLLCALVVGSTCAWADSYEKITSLAEVTNGDYVIVGCQTSSSFGLLTYGTLNSSRIPYTKSYNSYAGLPESISDPNTNSVWTLTRTDNTVKIYNAKQDKWLTSTISYVAEASATSFTIAYSTGDYGMFSIANGTSYLGVNKSSNYWKCYASTTLTATNGLTLYKKVVESGEETTTTINASGISNTNLYIGTAAGTMTASVSVTSTSVIVDGAKVTWSSSDESVATVGESTGVVTLVGTGKTTITASYSGVSGTYKSSSSEYELTVINEDPNAVTLWSEDFSTTDYSTRSTKYSYTTTNSSAVQPSDNYAEGEAPEMMLKATGGTFNATIPLENIVGDLSLKFKTNANSITVSTATEGISIPGTATFDTKEEHTVTFTGVTKSKTSISITFTAGSKNVRLDDIVLKGSKVAPVTVGSKGYATYCNATSALDFTGKSIAAYTISSTDGTTLTLSQKNKVAKNEPVLLYSSTNNDSQDIPVIADAAATATVGNKLVKGDDAAHTWVEGTAEQYVLATATVEPGFYRANNNTVSSTKAYLDLTGLAPGAHSFTLDLGEGDVTGIANVNVEKDTMNGAFYNLAGQRVAQPTKGLYIVNGKKVIIK